MLRGIATVRGRQINVRGNQNRYPGREPEDELEDEPEDELEDEPEYLDDELDEEPGYPDDDEPEQPPSQTLAGFIQEYQHSITQKVIETYRPTYQPQNDHHRLPALLRRPIGKQSETIRGAVHSLGLNRGTTVVGEMGTGKTFIAIVAAQMAGFRRVLVMCPPHLVQKWKREVEMTLPPKLASASIVKSVTDLRRLRQNHGNSRDGDARTLFVIMSREKAKLSYPWDNQVHWTLPMAGGRLIRTEDDGLLIRDEADRNVINDDGEIDIDAAHRWLQRLPRCLECWLPLQDKEGVYLSEQEVLTMKKRLKCLSCGAPLWGARSNGDPARNRVALAEYAKKKMKGFFDLFVADEVHEYKSRDSAQGIAAGGSAQLCGKSLVLSGTLMGGYASTLFYLLYRFYPEFRSRFGYNAESEWIHDYGFYQETIKYDSGRAIVIEDGSMSKRKTSSKRSVKESPGLMPSALFHLIENTIFLRLNDVSADLPPYEEHVITMPMDAEPDETGWSQSTGYRHLYRQIHAELVQALQRGSARLLAIYLQTLLAYPDGSTKGEVVHDPETGALIAAVPPLSEERTYPKEKQLLDLIRSEKDLGRRVLVYVTHTDTRDITGRLAAFLERDGHRTAVLKAGTPKPEDREKWIAEQVAQGKDVVVCNPKLVQTGLDLVDFPTIVWFETEYSVYVMRQASRRSWRIGQKKPVRVYYMTYQDCIQADALKLIAMKMQSSLAVEGELPEDGLSAYGDTQDNLMISLAKQIAGHLGPRTTTADLEETLRRVREMDEAGETELVDDTWTPIADDHVEPERGPSITDVLNLPKPTPTPVGANGKAKPSRNGTKPAAAKAAPRKREPEPEAPTPPMTKTGQLSMFSMDEFIKS